MIRFKKFKKNINNKIMKYLKIIRIKLIQINKKLTIVRVASLNLINLQNKIVKNLITEKHLIMI